MENEEIVNYKLVQQIDIYKNDNTSLSKSLQKDQYIQNQIKNEITYKTVFSLLLDSYEFNVIFPKQTTYYEHFNNSKVIVEDMRKIPLKIKSIKKLLKLANIEESEILSYILYYYTTINLETFSENLLTYNINYDRLMNIIDCFHFTHKNQDIIIYKNSLKRIIEMCGLTRDERFRYMNFYEIEEKTIKNYKDNIYSKNNNKNSPIKDNENNSLQDNKNESMVSNGDNIDSNKNSNLNPLHINNSENNKISMNKKDKNSKKNMDFSSLQNENRTPNKISIKSNENSDFLEQKENIAPNKISNIFNENIAYIGQRETINSNENLSQDMYNNKNISSKEDNEENIKDKNLKENKIIYIDETNEEKSYKENKNPNYNENIYTIDYIDKIPKKLNNMSIYNNTDKSQIKISDSSFRNNYNNKRNKVGDLSFDKKNPKKIKNSSNINKEDKNKTKINNSSKENNFYKSSNRIEGQSFEDKKIEKKNIYSNNKKRDKNPSKNNESLSVNNEVKNNNLDNRNSSDINYENEINKDNDIPIIMSNFGNKMNKTPDKKGLNKDMEKIKKNKKKSKSQIKLKNKKNKSKFKEKKLLNKKKDGLIKYNINNINHKDNSELESNDNGDSKIIRNSQDILINPKINKICSKENLDNNNYYNCINGIDELENIKSKNGNKKFINFDRNEYINQENNNNFDKKLNKKIKNYLNKNGKKNGYINNNNVLNIDINYINEKYDEYINNKENRFINGDNYDFVIDSTKSNSRIKLKNGLTPIKRSCKKIRKKKKLIFEIVHGNSVTYNGNPNEKKVKELGTEKELIYPFNGYTKFNTSSFSIETPQNQTIEIINKKVGEYCYYPFILRKTPELQNKKIYLSGSLPKLGNWDPLRAIKMDEEYRNGEEFFSKYIEVLKSDIPFEYKYFYFEKDKINWIGIPFVNYLTFPQFFDSLRALKKSHISILDLNIRYINDIDGINIWNNRKNKLIELLLNKKADIFFFQEITHSQSDFINRHLSSMYEYVGEYRDSTDTSEKCSIYVNKLKYTILRSGQFWLSSTPDIPGSNDFGNFFPRICTWASLKQIEGISLLFMNVHLDHVNKQAHLPCVKILLKEEEKIEKRFNDIHFVFIAGCFYCEENDEEIKYIKDNGYTEVQYENTFHGFTGLASNHWDYMFWREKNGNDIQFKEAHVLKKEGTIDELKKHYISDHFPVYAEFFLNNV